MRQMANSGDTKSMQLVKHFMFAFSVYGVVDGFSCLFVPTKNSITIVTDHPSDVFNRNMSKSKGWTLQSSLLMLWMDENSNQQSNKNC